jgi:hypothetical protein
MVAIDLPQHGLKEKNRVTRQRDEHRMTNIYAYSQIYNCIGDEENEEAQMRMDHVKLGYYEYRAISNSTA